MHEGRSARDARAIVEADLRRLDRIEAVWTELTDEEQETLAALAEAMHRADPKVEQDPGSGRWYVLDAEGERLHGPYLDRPKT